jgi:hypothetical protein
MESNKREETEAAIIADLQHREEDETSPERFSTVRPSAEPSPFFPRRLTRADVWAPPEMPPSG